MTTKKFLILLLALVAIQVHAEVKLPKIFSSNMVLQQGIEIPVWGWGNKGEQVIVTFNNTSLHTKADKNGKWSIKLPAQEYGGPYTLTVKGKNTIEFKNVMVGEVWVCSGQSNMEFQLANASNGAEEIEKANYPKMRLFTVSRRTAQFPEDDLTSGEWVECSPETASQFSAVAYFFGKSLVNKLDVPIGLIHTSWGGTVAETWTSQETIKNDPDFKEALSELQHIDLDNYRQLKTEKLEKILGGTIPSNDLGIQNGQAIWAVSDFDDSSWKSISTPALWEGEGFPDIDGIAWYRKEINLTEEQIQADATLHLGKIDDNDITFWNGVKIGAINQYDANRIYTVEKNILKVGKNVLTVRVEDTGGGGGIYGAPDDLYLVANKQKIDVAGAWKFKISKAVIGNETLGPNSYPTLLYNGMINPLVPYAIKGAIWYQGESNADRAKQYQRIFPNMISDWRNHWNQGDFTFLFVQLANYMKPAELPTESTWAELREAQTMTLDLPNTGMASAIDIGEANDIHPKNKEDVGKRLALNAFKIAYKQEVVNSGPMFDKVEFRNGKAVVTFKSTGSGLITKDKYGYVKAFTLAGPDHKFYWAKAKITDNNTIEVGCDAVSNPVAVRFGWADNPEDLNLYNAEGLPAVPFRSDDWPGIAK